jgi:hypothetical protein
MKKFCSQLSTYFKRHMGFEARVLSDLLRVGGENEITQENIRDWLELDGDPCISASCLF